MTYSILTDADVEARLSMSAAIRAVEIALREHSLGTLVAPPRFAVPGGRNSLVFTVGGTAGAHKVLGFRVYDTFGDEAGNHTQIVAVYDGATGALNGILLSNRLGAIRTGAIGGVAIDRLARKDARQLAILGTGTQARTQLEAAVCVREFETIRAFSPTREHREAFAREMTERTRHRVEAVDRPGDAVDGAEVVVCATTSRSPVLLADGLVRGAHVSTLGGVFRGGSEIDPGVVELSTRIVTDSRAQLESYSEPSLVVGTSHASRLVQLGDVVTGRAPGRTSDADNTLFVSVGLAGTEVIVADELLRRS